MAENWIIAMIASFAAAILFNSMGWWLLGLGALLFGFWCLLSYFLS